MTRKEYNDYRYIRSYKTKGFPLTYGTTLRIPVARSVDYKLRLHKLFSEWGFHPAGIRDNSYFDDETCIVYIYGREWTDADGRAQPWTYLYTEKERASFDAALHS